VTRVNVAVILLATGIVLNLVVLLRGEESPGWPIAAIVFLTAAAMTLASQRREP
jgi:hypothetical protein